MRTRHKVDLTRDYAKTHVGVVHLIDGCYVWQVYANDDLSRPIAAGGAERSLPTIEDLVEDSKVYVDWRYSVSVLRELRAARLLGYSREAQELLASIM